MISKVKVVGCLLEELGGSKVGPTVKKLKKWNFSKIQKLIQKVVRNTQQHRISDPKPKLKPKPKCKPKLRLMQIICILKWANFEQV